VEVVIVTGKIVIIVYSPTIPAGMADIMVSFEEL